MFKHAVRCLGRSAKHQLQQQRLLNIHEYQVGVVLRTHAQDVDYVLIGAGVGVCSMCWRESQLGDQGGFVLGDLGERGDWDASWIWWVAEKGGRGC